MPLAQGELVSCYATPAREHDDGEVFDVYDDAYAASRGSSCGSARPACSTCATRTTAASPCTSDAGTGRILVFAAIDNLWKGAASQAVQYLNLMFGRDEREGLR